MKAEAEQDHLDKPLIDLIFRPRKKRESKTEEKLREKRKRIVELQYLHGEKPEVIARRLGVGLRFVYNTTLFLRNKLRLKKGEPPEQAVKPAELLPFARVRLGDRPEVQEAVREYLLERGIHRLTLKKVKSFVVARLPALARIHLKEISHVLKHQHFLRMERLNPATFRYRDPFYDEKRLWFCRLVTQFVLDGALVVSIDETHFRHDALKRRAWQFHPKAVDIMKRARLREDPGKRESRRPAAWGVISEEISERSLRERNASRRRPPGSQGRSSSRGSSEAGSSRRDDSMAGRGPRSQRARTTQRRLESSSRSDSEESKRDQLGGGSSRDLSQAREGP